MNQAKVIQIILPDGSPVGIKIVSIKSNQYEAVLIPRSKLKDAEQRKELSKPGIYFLFGAEKEFGKREVYIGESENCYKRLQQHNIAEEEWVTAVAFVCLVENEINKAHIKYLEALCCQNAQKINRFVLTNGTAPKQNTINEADEVLLFNFLETIKLLLGTLGFPLFEEYRQSETTTNNKLFCKGKEAKAEGEYTEEGLLVFKGSSCNLLESPTAGSWIINMRKKLIEENILKQEDQVLVFQEDYIFASPSAAAATVLARRANGWIEWKDTTGKTLDELERK